MGGKSTIYYDYVGGEVQPNKLIEVPCRGGLTNTFMNLGGGLTLGTLEAVVIRTIFAFIDACICITMGG